MRHILVFTPGHDRTASRLYASCQILIICSLFPPQSANLCLSTLITGAIGRTIFALGLGQCIGVIVGTNILTCAIVGYMSAMGPKLGMRQMVITRYSFGWCEYGVVVSLSHH